MQRRHLALDLRVMRSVLSLSSSATLQMLISMTSSRPLVLLFTAELGIVPHAVAYLRIVSLEFPFYAFGMVAEQALNGAGDTRSPTLINLFVFWVLQIPLAHVLARYPSLGPNGVFVTLAACFSVFAVAAVGVFRFGRWKRMRI